MAIDRTIIYKILAQHLQNNFSEPTQICWENVDFKPTHGTSWIQDVFIPNNSVQETMGLAGSIKDFGLYQINVRTPLGRGNTEANTIIQELSLLFKHGLKLSLDGYDVFIDRCTPAQGIKSEGYWFTPLTIYWSCFMTIN